MTLPICMGEGKKKKKLQMELQNLHRAELQKPELHAHILQENTPHKPTLEGWRGWRLTEKLGLKR